MSTPRIAPSGGASAGAAATSMSVTSSSSVLTINQQVSAFLSSVSPALADNQYLKMVIAALILQFLLGDGNVQQQTGQGGINLLESLASGRQNTLQITLESSTNVVQLEQQSTRLDVIGAVQTMSSGDEANNQSGGTLDLQA
jgi:phospholipase/lecithinase/hemolysin